MKIATVIPCPANRFPGDKKIAGIPAVAYSLRAIPDHPSIIWSMAASDRPEILNAARSEFDRLHFNCGDYRDGISYGEASARFAEFAQDGEMETPDAILILTPDMPMRSPDMIAKFLDWAIPLVAKGRACPFCVPSHAVPEWQFQFSRAGVAPMVGDPVVTRQAKFEIPMQGPGETRKGFMERMSAFMREKVLPAAAKPLPPPEAGEVPEFVQFPGYDPRKAVWEFSPYAVLWPADRLIAERKLMPGARCDPFRVERDDTFFRIQYQSDWDVADEILSQEQP